MSLEIAARISDPIHGTIGITAIERDIIAAPAFQRLRNVKQLGLAHYVFPGSDYSRLAHSLGVCHIAAETFGILSTRCPEPRPDDREIQQYRLAALLHDCGHYPFSHAMEYAFKNFYSQTLLAGPGLPPGTEPKRWFKHERVGKEVLEKDAGICTALKTAGYEPREIYSIFLREKPPRFANLISSDLDADRIDYLRRTAHTSGLPYGAVDIEYLMDRLLIDKDMQVCVSPKALRTVDHFLLCRFFDYQQVSFHKTVAALELVLKDICSKLLEHNLLDGSADAITARIESGQWHEFDDAYIVGLIRRLQTDTTDPIIKLKTEAVLDRNPPRLVASFEYIGNRTKEAKQEFTLKHRIVQQKVKEWAGRFGLDEQCWYTWVQPGMALTKVGATTTWSAAAAADN
jgi:HD superfamily phosphohydrolase